MLGLHLHSPRRFPMPGRHPYYVKIHNMMIRGTTQKITRWSTIQDLAASFSLSELFNGFKNGFWHPISLWSVQNWLPIWLRDQHCWPTNTKSKTNWLKSSNQGFTNHELSQECQIREQTNVHWPHLTTQWLKCIPHTVTQTNYSNRSRFFYTLSTPWKKRIQQTTSARLKVPGYVHDIVWSDRADPTTTDNSVPSWRNPHGKEMYIMFLSSIHYCFDSTLDSRVLRMHN